jgi:hypothetical protein
MSTGCRKSLESIEFLVVVYLMSGARGIVVTKALCYKPEGRGFETRWGE